jgi:hypothetical protein
MGSPRNPLFGVDINLNVNINAEQVVFAIQMVLDHLALPTNERLMALEEDMRRVDTLLRELKEGIEALKVQKAEHDAQHEADAAAEQQEDLDAAALDETQKARITELEGIIADLQTRALSPDKQAELDAAVEELATLTGNVITEDESEPEA